MSHSRKVIDDRLNAFCTDTEAYLEGAKNGSLSGLTFAAKDIFDVAGHVTGGGNPDWKATHDAAERTAWAVKVLVGSGASMVGKTHTDELTRGIFGDNPHYGTPLNPMAPDRVPGGSSSGSASAVAGGLVDFALGSDTLGSVRVPASYCGIYGMRPTLGRISLDGVLLQAASYDTVGWFARDMEVFTRVGSVLLQREIVESQPLCLVIAEDAFALTEKEVADALQPAVAMIASLIGNSTKERLAATSLTDWANQQLTLQSREAWETVKDWVTRVNPRFSFRVSKMYAAASACPESTLKAARLERDKVIARMNEVLTEGTVVCLPTASTPARPRKESLSDREAIQPGLFGLISIASTTGTPQISMPLAEVAGLPVGLSLIGPKGSDEMLIAFARKVASSVGHS